MWVSFDMFPGTLRPYSDSPSGWELDPVEAPIVREMFRLAVVANLGQNATADRLTQTAEH